MWARKFIAADCRFPTITNRNLLACRDAAESQEAERQTGTHALLLPNGMRLSCGAEL
jgi:hypothetical protein